MMNPMLTKLTTEARTDDLRRATARAALRREAGAHRRRAAEPAVEEAITIRTASSSDTAALARLAELDSARMPTGTVLVAEADGRLLAALSLSDGVSVADPFHPTAAIVQLLVARAAQLRTEPRQRRLFARVTGARAPWRRRRTALSRP